MVTQRLAFRKTVVKHKLNGLFPFGNLNHAKDLGVAKRYLRADLMVIQNIRALLVARGLDDKALAMWCGHRPAWLSKILNGERGLRIRDLGCIADFFGLTVSDMFQYGISAMHERRRAERRTGQDRRSGTDRRERIIGAIHPDVRARFPHRYDDGEEHD